MRGDVSRGDAASRAASRVQSSRSPGRCGNPSNGGAIKWKIPGPHPPPEASEREAEFRRPGAALGDELAAYLEPAEKKRRFHFYNRWPGGAGVAGAGGSDYDWHLNLPLTLRNLPSGPLAPARTVDASASGGDHLNKRSPVHRT